MLQTALALRANISTSQCLRSQTIHLHLTSPRFPVLTNTAVLTVGKDLAHLLLFHADPYHKELPVLQSVSDNLASVPTGRLPQRHWLIAGKG